MFRHGVVVDSYTVPQLHDKNQVFVCYDPEDAAEAIRIIEYLRLRGGYTVHAKDYQNAHQYFHRLDQSFQAIRASFYFIFSRLLFLLLIFNYLSIFTVWSF